MRRAPFVLVSVLAAVLAGCATTSVGTIDMTEPMDPIEGRTLLVVALPSSFGGASGGLSGFLGGGRPDTLKIQEFVPLDSIGASSYVRYAEGAVVDVLQGVLQEEGAWTRVAVGPPPADVEILEQTYTVQTRSLWGGRKRARRIPIQAPAAGSADVFGPDVDYVLFVQDAGLVLAEGAPGAPVSMGPGMGSMPGGKGDDAVMLRADLVLWDDEAGAVIAYGTVTGFAPIESRMFSSAEERTPSALVAKAKEGLAESVSDELPALVRAE